MLNLSRVERECRIEKGDFITCPSPRVGAGLGLRNIIIFMEFSKKGGGFGHSIKIIIFVKVKKVPLKMISIT